MKRIFTILAGLFLFAAANATPPFTVLAHTVVASSTLWSPTPDLNQLIVTDWNTAALSNGAVSSWTDATGFVTATQATSTNQPVMSSSAGGLQFGANQWLTFGTYGSPTTTNRAIILLFKANLSTAPQTQGSFFFINGDGSGDQQAPLVGYHSPGASAPTDVPYVQWNSVTNRHYTSSWGSDSDWHVLLDRRVNGVSYISIDGGTETTLGPNILLLRNASNANGEIGDFRAPSGITWILKRLLVVQGELTTTQRDQIQGWAMWNMGEQANLPGGHPYKSAPPTTSPYVSPYPNVDNATYTATYQNWFATTADIKQNYGNAIVASETSGWATDFDTTFTSGTIPQAEYAAPCTPCWYSPVINATGGSEIDLVPGGSPVNVFSNDGTAETITMQKSGANWYSSTMVSVNLDGQGYYFDPSQYPMYVEYTVLLGNGNGKSVWHAKWFKPKAEFFNVYYPHFENDIDESYNSDDNGDNIHFTLHTHTGRPYPGYPTTALSYGKDLFVDSAHGWPEGDTSLFDGTYHKVGFIFDKNLTGTVGGPGFMVLTLDGFEVARAPILSYWLQPTYLILSQNQLPAEASLAAGTYPMTVSEIKVLRGTHYLRPAANDAHMHEWRERRQRPLLRVHDDLRDAA